MAQFLKLALTLRGKEAEKDSALTRTLHPVVEEAWDSIPSELRGNFPIRPTARELGAYFDPRRGKEAVYASDELGEAGVEQARAVLLHELGHAHRAGGKMLHHAWRSYNWFLLGVFHPAVWVHLLTTLGRTPLSPNFTTYLLILVLSLNFFFILFTAAVRRREEYAADTYSATHGDSASLRAYFLRHKVEKPTLLRRLTNVFSTHPLTAYRLARLRHEDEALPVDSSPQAR